MAINLQLAQIVVQRPNEQRTVFLLVDELPMILAGGETSQTQLMAMLQRLLRNGHKG
jgi:hypothetical protein